MFKMIVFDLDGTLAPSKGQMDIEMVELFKKLLQKYKVGVISGGDYPQYQKQIIPFLGDDSSILSNLYACPTCSTKMYLYKNGNWEKQYSLDFTEAEKIQIIDAFNISIDNLNLRPAKTWGELIEDRGTQITFSALGQEAPYEEKHKWDPDFEIRKKLRDEILKHINGFNILIGGATSVDITKKGVDKAYGVRKLAEISGIEMDEIIFVGDAIFPGGNDFPPLEIGVTSKKVFDVEDTKKYIKMLIS